MVFFWVMPGDVIYEQPLQPLQEFHMKFYIKIF